MDAPTAPSHWPSFGISRMKPDQAPEKGEHGTCVGSFFSLFVASSDLFLLLFSVSAPSHFLSSSASSSSSFFSRLGGWCPSVSITHASCTQSSRSCVVLNCRHMVLCLYVPGNSSFSYENCASKTDRSSNSALSTCTACVHTAVPPAAPFPEPHLPTRKSGRCVLKPAIRPLIDTCSACNEVCFASACLSSSKTGCHRNG
mmetsp:Transcript_212/g.772  ORF Transcript_212/g.772 Transcript_212/m.772 type:complete len:200 (-) Transcript_212:1538-2137(-)